jgi:sec-independent protein translocase protein TatA
MPDIGPTEIMIVAVLALVVLGPKRLPDAGRSFGRSLRGFKLAVGGGSDASKQQDAAALGPPTRLGEARPLPVDLLETSHGDGGN